MKHNEDKLYSFIMRGELTKISLKNKGVSKKSISNDELLKEYTTICRVSFLWYGNLSKPLRFVCRGGFFVPSDRRLVPFGRNHRAIPLKNGCNRH